MPNRPAYLKRMAAPALLALGLAATGFVLAQELKKPKADENTYLPVVIGKDFETIFKEDSAQKDQVVKQQQALFEKRYDLSDNPSEVKMAGGARRYSRGCASSCPRASPGSSWRG